MMSAEKNNQFFIGISEISAFLKLSYRTCARYLREGKITGAKKDCLGRWVLASVDYYSSLRDLHGAEQQNVNT
jgi:hypothetical protein